MDTASLAPLTLAAKPERRPLRRRAGPRRAPPAEAVRPDCVYSLPELLRETCGPQKDGETADGETPDDQKEEKTAPADVSPAGKTARGLAESLRRQDPALLRRLLKPALPHGILTWA
ncbi:MAG: hypothetical protein LBG69_08080 [Zoogloeaceae bacterium]|jgi:hypothetical protein|nr:hypothetical protein [Zoogloeaceae bacterium]